MTSFYSCVVAKKALRILQRNARDQKKFREDAVSLMHANYLRKVLYTLKYVADRTKVFVAMRNPSQIYASSVWLRHSFSKVMGAVWRDFPRQEVKIDYETGQELCFRNYLQLSKRPRYY